MHSCSNNRAVINYDEPCIETSFFLLPLAVGRACRGMRRCAARLWGSRPGRCCSRLCWGWGGVQRCISNQAPSDPRSAQRHDTYTGQHARMRQRASMRRICTCMRATRVHARGKGAICTAGACMCVRHCVPLPTQNVRGDVFAVSAIAMLSTKSSLGSSGIAAATTWPSQCESLLQWLPSRLVVALASAPTGS